MTVMYAADMLILMTWRIHFYFSNKWELILRVYGPGANWWRLGKIWKIYRLDDLGVIPSVTLFDLYIRHN